jgi:hypothetical protein
MLNKQTIEQNLNVSVIGECDYKNLKQTFPPKNVPFAFHFKEEYRLKQN